MDLKEFRDKGYLHEVNRLLLHRVGLALAWGEDEEGNMSLAGIVDFSDAPEGMVFTSELMSDEKIKFVEGELEKRRGARAALPYCDENGVQVRPPEEDV